MFFLRSIGALIFIIVIVVLVTNFSGVIQQHTGSVLGVTINPKQSIPFPNKLQNDVSTSIDNVQQNGSEISVEDVTSFLGRTQKVIKDYQTVQKELQKTIDTFFEKDAEKEK